MIKILIENLRGKKTFGSKEIFHVFLSMRGLHSLLIHIDMLTSLHLFYPNCSFTVLA